MDMKTQAKSKVLEQLIELMDSKMVDGLKSKSPKFAKVDIQSDDPELAEDLKDKVVDGMEETEEKPKLPEEPMEEKNPEDEDDMKRLMELYKGLK